MKLSAFIYGLAISMLLAVPLSATAQHRTKSAPCNQCHSCINPTAGNPCLRACPRPRTEQKELEKGPETVVLNELEREYEPVIFPHQLHANMSRMDVGCTDCHHFTDIGDIASCKTCHPVDVAEENLKQPGLRGAYHRQCLGCHQEWSQETSCEVCHVKKGETTPYAETPSPGMGFRRYGSLEEPTTRMWESTYGGGTKVTLHHRNHTEKYGIECASCHHAEGCKSCHSRDGKADANGNTMQVRHSEEALHAICNQCHAEMSCDQCHLKEEAAEFSHDRTGWPLGHRHDRLTCKTCHGSPNHFTKPSPDCNSCHAKWTNLNFSHTRTGLALNETHRVFECTECHADRNFAVPPACSNCHDKDIAFPKAIPGYYVNRKS
jgi:hypothetical protein